MVRLVKGENDLSTFSPTLAKEWHPTKNGDLKPEDISPGSSKEVWWLCPEGHPYLMVVNQRAKRGYGCPYCSGQGGLRRSGGFALNAVMSGRQVPAIVRKASDVRAVVGGFPKAV